MLARQGVDSVQALFYFLQACRIGVEVVQEAIQFAHGFLNLDLCTGQQGGGFIQRAGSVVHAGQAIEAGGKGVEHIARIALAALFDHLAADAQQSLGIGQVLVFLLKLLQLRLAQAQAFKLFELIAEQLVTSALFVA